MKYQRKQSGFTLFELMISLAISAIILSAVASLTYAVSYAIKDTEEISKKQARVRMATLKIKELVKNCKMIVYSESNLYSSDNDTVIWESDADGDIRIDSDEIVYIDTGSNDKIELVYFNSGASFSISQFESGAAQSWLWSKVDTRATFLEDCSNVSVGFDVATPQSRFMSISFDYDGPDRITTFEINAQMTGASGYLLNSSGELYSSDDD